MFERFTDRARRVLVLAQEEARLLQDNFIGTEHLLLGLLDEGDGIAARALRDYGVTVDALRADLADARSPQEPYTPMGSPPFTPRAKKVLELSLRETLQRSTNHIGTEHMLLAILREGEGVAVQLLVAVGVDLGQLRERVVSFTAGGAHSTVVEPSERPVTGPRCPYCSRRLEQGGVAYKVLKVPRSDRDVGADIADIAFVYCTRCGRVIAHAPFSDLEAPTEPLA